MGQLDFHQIPLNVKLRVKGEEHGLQRLMGEKRKRWRKEKANDLEMPAGGCDRNKTEEPRKRIDVDKRPQERGVRLNGQSTCKS